MCLKVFRTSMIVITLLLVCTTTICSADSLASPTYESNGSYNNYYNEYKGILPSPDALEIEALYKMSADGANISIIKDYADYDGAVVVWNNETGSATWEATVKSPGIYRIYIDYLALPGNSETIEKSIRINGDYPFKESEIFALKRLWCNSSNLAQYNNQGDQIRPSQKEVSAWQHEAIKDVAGRYGELCFFFKSGVNRITIEGKREKVAIGSVILDPVKKEVSYFDYKEMIGSENLASDPIIVQGEEATFKSDSTLYALSDHSSASVEPQNYNKFVMNYIGGYNWRMPNQKITWSFEAKEEGWYRLNFKYRQSYIADLPVTRAIYIDEKTLFEEMKNVEFAYGSEWQIQTLGDASPKYVYLVKGKHNITLENRLGRMGEIIQNVEATTKSLLSLYNRIVMVTGISPDPYRDYELDKILPDLVDILTKNSETLSAQIEKINSIAGKNSSAAAVIKRVVLQLESFIQKPETIQKRLGNYKDNMSSLSTWLMNASDQPLDIDFICFSPIEMDPPKASVGFFKTVIYNINYFISSFLRDYTTLGNKYEESKAIDVWVLMGRDQADTLKLLIDNQFVPNNGIQVNLNIMQNESVLLFALTSNSAPDIALNVSRTLPVDYGLRKALVDFNTLKDIDEVKSRFSEQSVIPYQYQEKLFGLPQVQGFPVMFYRTDILKQLNVDVPQTWNDVYQCISKLQERNLGFALGSGIDNFNFDIFNMFLLQHGNSYYDKTLTKSTLDNASSIKAFSDWTELYTNYGVPYYFDFYNRFRTGEMPIGIADYSLFNQLSVAAPEIRGQWKIALIPGTMNADGIVDRSESGWGTSMVMFKSSKKQQQSWEFIKWWTSDEIQTIYGRELEAVLGIAARYNTANIKAASQLSWPKEDFEIISEQWKSLKEIPIIPGSYYTNRHIDNAFKEVFIQGVLPRDAIEKYVIEINKEIIKKRKELGLVK